MNVLAVSGGQAGAPIAFVLLAEAHLATGSPESAEVARAGLAMADAIDQHFVDAELLRLEALASCEAGMSVAETVDLLGARLRRRSSGTGRPGTACGLRPRIPRTAGDRKSRCSAQAVEGGNGTRDHGWP